MKLSCLKAVKSEHRPLLITTTQGDNLKVLISYSKEIETPITFHRTQISILTSTFLLHCYVLGRKFWPSASCTAEMQTQITQIATLSVLETLQNKPAISLRAARAISNEQVGVNSPGGQMNRICLWRCWSTGGSREHGNLWMGRFHPTPGRR